MVWWGCPGGCLPVPPFCSWEGAVFSYAGGQQLGHHLTTTLPSCLPAVPACSALKAVLDRVTAAAQQKDGLLTAAQREVAAATAARDAALAEAAASRAAADGWHEQRAAAEQSAASAPLASAEQQLLRLQLSGAADAQRWEEQLLHLQRQLQKQQRGGAGATAQQQLLQAEVQELRQLVSAKDQQIGALSSSAAAAAAAGGIRPGSGGQQVTPQQAQRLQAQVRLARLLRACLLLPSLFLHPACLAWSWIRFAHTAMQPEDLLLLPHHIAPQVDSGAGVQG